MTNNTPAEHALLGCYLLDSNIGRYAVRKYGLHDGSAFADALSQQVWKAICDVESSGTYVDLISVQARIPSQEARLNKLIDSVPTCAHAEHYAQQVADAKMVNDAAEICQKLVSELLDGKPAASRIQAAVSNLSDLGAFSDVPVYRIGDFSENKDRQWEAARQGKTIGIPFCIDAVNCVLGGLRYGIMSILAAYRNTGKSTLARQQAIHTAKSGLPTLLFTLEDPADTTDANIAGHEAGVSVFHLDTGQSCNENREKMHDAWQRLKDVPLWIVDRNAGIHAMSAIVDRMVRQHGIKLVVVDHIHYIAPQELPGMNRVRTLASYSSTVCGWARDYDMHVMVLGQLSQEKEKQNRARVRMSDIRDCGSLVDDARQILSLYDTDSGHVLEVLKNNAGISSKAIHVRRMDGYQRFDYDDER